MLTLLKQHTFSKFYRSVRSYCCETIDGGGLLGICRLHHFTISRCQSWGMCFNCVLVMRSQDGTAQRDGGSSRIAPTKNGRCNESTSQVSTTNLLERKNVFVVQWLCTDNAFGNKETFVVSSEII